jgi:hypothetical protein
MSVLAVDTDICPACLAELPAGYLFDHVAIDRAAGGDRALFARMQEAERREVVTTTLARGAGLHNLAQTLNWPYTHLQALLPDSHPESRQSQQADAEQLIRQLWEQGLQDTTISARTGLNPSKVGRIRKRLGLGTLPRRPWKPVTA